MSSQRPTMLDVAALAGRPRDRVARRQREARGERVHRRPRPVTMAQLDYRHDVQASSLRRLDRKTATIGLVLEDVANPFMSALHRAVEDSARARGMLVFAGSCDEDSGREREFISALRGSTGRRHHRRASRTGSQLPAARAAGGHGDRLRRPPPALSRRGLCHGRRPRGGTFMAVSHLVGRATSASRTSARTWRSRLLKSVSEATGTRS